MSDNYDYEPGRRKMKRRTGERGWADWAEQPSLDRERGRNQEPGPSDGAPSQWTDWAEQGEPDAADEPSGASTKEFPPPGSKFPGI